MSSHRFLLMFVHIKCISDVIHLIISACSTSTQMNWHYFKIIAIYHRIREKSLPNLSLVHKKKMHCLLESGTITENEKKNTFCPRSQFMINTCTWTHNLYVFHTDLLFKFSRPSSYVSVLLFMLTSNTNTGENKIHQKKKYRNLLELEPKCALLPITIIYKVIYVVFFLCCIQPQIPCRLATQKCIW